MVKAITYILANNATVGALVGSNVIGDTKKFYPMLGPQGEKFPYVTVWESSRTPEFCKGQRPTTFNYTYNVNVYAKDYDEADAICIAIINAIETQSITSAINGVTFTDRIRNTNRRDAGYVQEEGGAYNKVLTFESTTNES